MHACGGNGRCPPPYISQNIGKPIKSCARMITYARRGGLDTHGIFHVHRNKAREHNANAMCTLNLTSGTCPKTCGNGQGALAQVFRALAHDYWPTYPNKIDQSRCLKCVHVHFNLPLPPLYSHPRTDHYTYISCHTMPPRTNKKAVAKKDGKAK